MYICLLCKSLLIFFLFSITNYSVISVTTFHCFYTLQMFHEDLICNVNSVRVVTFNIYIILICLLSWDHVVDGIYQSNMEIHFVRNEIRFVDLMMTVERNRYKRVTSLQTKPLCT